MAKQKNPFDIFKAQETKTAKIEALGGATIKYRELTLAESDEFAQKPITGFNQTTGQPDFDITVATEVKYEKVAAALIEPKMTAEELKSLPKSSQPAIDEILNLIDASPDEVDEEGN